MKNSFIWHLSWPQAATSIYDSKPPFDEFGHICLQGLAIGSCHLLKVPNRHRWHHPNQTTPLSELRFPAERDRETSLGDDPSWSYHTWGHGMVSSRNTLEQTRQDLEIFIDHWKLNAITWKDSYPVPSLNDASDAMKVSDRLSFQEAPSCFCQIPMHREDHCKTTFVCHLGI